MLKYERLIWLDALKGVLILLVVLGHAIQYCLPGGECEHNYWWNLIYSFHMPAFMAASGYINYRPENYRGGVNICKRRTYQLLIPFFMWSMIKWTVSANHSLSSLINITFNNGGFFWFLWALWVITLISITCNHISCKLKVPQEITYSSTVGLLTICMVILDIRFFGFQSIAYYFIFYTLGYFLNKYQNLLTTNIYIIVLCSFLWLVLANSWNMHELPCFLEDITFIPKTILQYLYRFSTAIIAVYLLISIFPQIFRNNSPRLNGLIFLGQHSLAIYGIQGVIIYFVCEYIINTNLFSSLVNQVLLSFIIVTFICVLLTKIGNKNAYSSRFLFGKIV